VPYEDASAGRLLARLRDVAAEAAAGAVERDRERRYDTALFDRLREIGFWALTVPVRYDGPGHRHDVLVQAVMTLAAADASIGQIPQNHFNSVERLAIWGSPRQRPAYLRRVAAGAFFGNATAEPGERPPGESATTLTRTDAGWSLTGRKVYATGALFADFVSVQAVDADGAPAAVLVPRGAPGMAVADDWQSFGQRTTASGTATFDGVAVDDLAVLRTPADPRPVYRVSGQSQLIHAAIDVGIAEGALAEARVLAGRAHGARGSGAARFAEDALGVAALGELRVATTAARRVVESAADRLARLGPASALDDVLDVFYEVVTAKVVSTRAALQATAGLFDVGGSSATHPSLGLDRYWRDARTHTLHDAVRWKPHSVGAWLADGRVADPWSLGAPLRPIDELREAT